MEAQFDGFARRRRSWLISVERAVEAKRGRKKRNIEIGSNSSAAAAFDGFLANTVSGDFINQIGIIDA